MVETVSMAHLFDSIITNYVLGRMPYRDFWTEETCIEFLQVNLASYDITTDEMQEEFA